MVLSKEICIAAQYGDFAALNEYIAAGGDLNDRSPAHVCHEEPLLARGHLRHAPLLYYATCDDRADVVRLLLAHGADPDIREGGGLTPLHRAVFRGFYDVAVLLLDAGADVDARSTKHPKDHRMLFDRTPLIQAAVNGQVDVVRLLLRRGASFDLRDCNGRTAEHLARLYYWNNPNREWDDEVEPEYAIISERQWVQNRMEAGNLLREVRKAGGWRRYIFPRRCLPVRLLRILCEMGRAKTDDTLLARLFPWHPPAAETDPETRVSLRARDTRSAGVPRDVFCLIFEFWRFVDDWRPNEPLAYGWAGDFPTYSAWNRAQEQRFQVHQELGSFGADTDDEELVGHDWVLGTENNPPRWDSYRLV